MARVALLLAGFAFIGCASEPAEPPRPLHSDAPPARQDPPDAASPMPFDASDVVFEPAEPPEAVVQIPPKPPPPPPPLPAPNLLPPPPPSRGPSGSCDVRETEGFCFAYTGAGWTPQDARAQCAAAPDARFGPGTCPLADRIATCAFERASAPGREIVYTYYAPYDLALAELACPGTFTRLD